MVAVLTHADIPGRNDCSLVYGDDPILAETVVSYVGQAVFAVVAETMRAARDALAHAVVTYEPLSAVLTIDQAMREGSGSGLRQRWRAARPTRRSPPRRCGFPGGSRSAGRNISISRGRRRWQSRARIAT